MKKYVYVSIALLFVISSALLPTPEGLTKNGQIMIGILAMAVFLWLTEAIPLSATGLLIMVLQPLFGIDSAKNVFSNFGNRAVFFILASFILASAIEKYGLHEKMAIRFLKIFGTSPKIFIFGVMITGAFLSFIMQEHGVAAILLPILMQILILMKIAPKESNFGIATMLALTYGTTIGSWGTLLGGARNPLTVGFLDEIGYSLSFLDWMKMNIPIVLISLPIVTIIILTFFPPEIKNIRGAIVEIEEDAKSKKVGREGKAVVSVLIATIFLWIFFSDEIGVAVIALLSAVSLFMLGLINWEDVEKRVQWGIILVYGGAITMGKGLEITNSAQWIAEKLLSVLGNNEYAVLICIILLTFLLTNLMSNTAAVATMLPISIGISLHSGISPVIAAMATAVAGGAGFIFVVATPGMAIAYSSGYLTQKHMAKAGIFSGLICLIIIFPISIFYWKMILHI
ncbi:MAG TPA: DASS family sodium-coupled anion symporter [Thermoplasmatales archaeon]|nr:DASS family sodium-coupled anion symporter [Thermoplasmatales archaeon]